MGTLMIFAISIICIALLSIALFIGLNKWSKRSAAAREPLFGLNNFQGRVRQEQILWDVVKTFNHLQVELPPKIIARIHAIAPNELANNSIWFGHLDGRDDSSPFGLHMSLSGNGEVITLAILSKHLLAQQMGWLDTPDH